MMSIEGRHLGTKAECKVLALVRLGILIQDFCDFFGQLLQGKGLLKKTIAMTQEFPTGLAFDAVSSCEKNSDGRIYFS